MFVAEVWPQRGGSPSTVGTADVVVGAVVTWYRRDLPPAFLPALSAVRIASATEASMKPTVSRNESIGFLNPSWYLHLRALKDTFSHFLNINNMLMMHPVRYKFNKTGLKAKFTAIGQGLVTLSARCPLMDVTPE